MVVVVGLRDLGWAWAIHNTKHDQVKAVVPPPGDDVACAGTGMEVDDEDGGVLGAALDIDAAAVDSEVHDKQQTVRMNLYVKFIKSPHMGLRCYCLASLSRTSRIFLYRVLKETAKKRGIAAGSVALQKMRQTCAQVHLFFSGGNA